MTPFTGLKPYQPEHVKKVLRALMYSKCAIDASDTGVGKTYTALCAARVLGVNPLVIGPKATRAGWEDASKHMGVPIEFINYERARGLYVKNNWFNPEVFGPSFVERMESKYGYVQPWGSGSMWVWKERADMIIFDEAHRCGGSKSIQGKMLRSARKGADYTLAMSATLADSVLQMKNIGLAMGLFTNKTYMSWLFKHGCKPGIFGGFDVNKDPEVQDQAMKKLHLEIFPKRGARLRRSEIPGFPETLIETKFVYEEDAGDMVNELQELANNDLAGYMRVKHDLEMLLIPHIVESAEDSKGDMPVVTFTTFIDTLDRAVYELEKRGLTVSSIDGRQTGERGDRERRRIIDAYQQNQLDALVVNAQAGGAGMSLHDPTGKIGRTADICPLESGRQLKQVLGRVHRSGGAFSLQRIWGFADTAQETILLTSLEKIRSIDALNDGDLDSLRLI